MLRRTPAPYLFASLALGILACGDPPAEPETMGTTGGSTGEATLQMSEGAADEPVADVSLDELTECELTAQDCPEGFKCAAAQVEPLVPASVCIPVSDDPLSPGEVCELDGPLLGGGTSDPCDETSVCVSNGGDFYEGICTVQCPNGESDCPAADENCIVGGDGALRFCLPSCDPLLQNCPAGAGCYVETPELFDLFCAPAQPTAGGYGTQCFGIQNLCEPGFGCYYEGRVAAPGCESVQCCTAWCDTTAPNTCPGRDNGEECIPVYPVDPPPGWEILGGCGLPE